MTKLNQVIAIEKRVKSDATTVLTKAYQDAQKPQLLSGISRTYTPRDDDGERFPPESTKVQIQATGLVDMVSAALTRFYDLTLTKDAANTVAKATIVVDGVTLAEDVPVTFCLFLEKQLQDVYTFITKLPVLDPSEEWEFSLAADTFATPVTKTVKTKKVPKNHVLSPATDKHPAQVQVFTEDVVIGEWATIKFSGAMPQQWINSAKERVSKLIEATKKAREEANMIQVVDRKVGETIFDYIFAH